MKGRENMIANPLAERVGYQLRRASSLMMADLAQRLGSLKLRPADASVLVMIQANPGITQSQIGRMLGIQRANMAPLAASLQARGAIVGEPVDGRSVGYRVTASGEALANDVFRHIDAHEERYLCDLGLGARKDLIDWLLRVQETEAEPAERTA
jgi:DNA-binding MarR family transcriptional regulator